jgi:hypothetical protein
MANPESRPPSSAPDRTPDDLVTIVYDDSPGDTRVRPRRPEIPLEYPRVQLPKPPTPPAKSDE